MPLAAPDWPVQQGLWEQLVAAKREWDVRLRELRSQLEALQRALGHGREQWRESHAAIETASAVLGCLDTRLPAPDGLRRLIAGCKGLCGASRPLGDRPLAPALAHVVACIESIGKFLADNAEPIIHMHGYLSSLELPARATVQSQQRERLLKLINSGEALVGRATMMARLWRSFQAAYGRAYLAWHDRCHKSAEFQRYRQLRSMPAYRAVQQLAKLSRPAQVSLNDIDRTLDEQRAKQCSNDGLRDDLRSSPVCPKCKLQVGASLELVPPEDVAESIQQALTEHIAALKQPHVRKALVEYAASAPTAELGNRIKGLTELAPDIAAPRLLATLSNELIAHARRAIGGRRIHTRSLEALRKQFAGRLLTKGDLQETLRQWLDERDELAGGELIHVE